MSTIDWDAFEAALADHVWKFGHLPELDEHGACRVCTIMQDELLAFRRDTDEWLASLPGGVSYEYEDE